MTPSFNRAALSGTIQLRLKPSLNDDFRIRKELKDFLSVRFGVTEHRVTGTAEREETHGRSDTDIDADHARFDTILEFAGGRPLLV